MDGEEMDCVSVADFQQVVQFLFQRISLLEDLVENQLIGGIKGLYDSHSRETGIGALKQKYGEKFGPMESALPSLGIPDWATTLFEELKKVQASSDDWNEDKELQYVENGITQLMDRISKIAGKPSGGEASLTVVKSGEGGEGEEGGEAPKSEGEGSGGESAPNDLAAMLNNMKSGRVREF